MHALAAGLVTALVNAEEKAPDAEDVTAGWLGFWVFLGLIIAVAVIGWALTKSLKTADRAKESGVYGDEPVSREDLPGQSDQPGPDRPER